MKQKILIAIVLLCLVGIVVLCVIFLGKKEKIENNAFKAIPDDVALIVEIENLNTASAFFSPGNDLWNALADYSFVENEKNFINRLDSAIKANESFSSFEKNELVVAVRQIGQNGKLDFLYVIPLDKTQDNKFVKSFVTNAFNIQKENSYVYDKQADVWYAEDAGLYYSMYGNTLIIAKSKVSVESGLKGFLDKKSVESVSSDFRKVKAHYSDVPAHVYFHYDRMMQIARLFWADDVASRYKNITKVASWTGLDMSLKKNGSIRLNGFVRTDSINYESEYFNIFNGQKSVRGSITSVMPSTANHFVAMCISNKELFRKNYEGYLERNSYFNSYSNALKECSSVFSSSKKVNVADMFYSWFDGEMAYVTLPSTSDNLYENAYAVIKIQSKKNTENDLKTMLSNYAEKNGTSYVSTDYVSPSGETHTIYTMPVTRIPSLLWGMFFTHVSAQYVALVDSYIVFANSLNACKTYISDLAKQSLSSDTNYGRFDDNVQSSYSLYMYTNMSGAFDMMKTNFDATTIRTLDKYSEKLRGMDAISYQLKADEENNVMYCDIYIATQQQKTTKPELSWRYSLDTTLAINPVNFVSHKGESLVLVQDAKNNLYLIDNTGRVIWSKPLDGKIQGTIHFVDALANKKQQYLFNTASSIYLIDRNGGNVGNFPLQLQSPSTSDIGVFDYEKNRKYRIMVPCEDNSVVLFAMEGGLWSTVQGWNFNTENIVTSAPRHFVDGGKDYIVLADKYHVYVLNRRGEVRISVDELIEKAPHSNIEFEGGANPSLSRFITTDVDGVVKEIYLDGTVKSTQFSKHSASHYFFVSDMNNDGNGDYIFVDDNKVEILANDGKKIGSYSASDVLANPSIFYGEGENFVAVYETKSEQLSLIDGKGSLYKGFPIRCKGWYGFKNNKDVLSRYSVTLGGEQNLLYNYRLK